MAKTSQNPKQDEVLVDIVEVRNKTQEFYLKYQNTFFITFLFCFAALTICMLKSQRLPLKEL